MGLQDPEGKYEALQKFARDLTAAARDGQLDPVIGRDDEIRRAVQILSRRTKNNPVLIGEPGLLFHPDRLRFEQVCPSWQNSSCLLSLPPLHTQSLATHALSLTSCKCVLKPLKRLYCDVQDGWWLSLSLIKSEAGSCL